jgi:hypothetical protein
MSTGTELPTYGTAFHADDTDEVVGYRTVSALAVVGMIIGLASPLCLAWPLLYWIPLLGAVICILAMRRIEASDGAVTGRGMATLGLVLCVLCGAAAVSRSLVTRTIRTAQAEDFGRDWIELLLAGDNEKAFRLTVEGNRREVAPPEPGATAPTQNPDEQFLENPLDTGMAAAGADNRRTSLSSRNVSRSLRKTLPIRTATTPSTCC